MNNILKIALKILLGNKSKYLALVFGVTFATLLISQQVSIFIGIISRTASVINDIKEIDVWVMDKRVEYIEEVEPLRDIELYRIRSVPGVKWAVPYFKGLALSRTPDRLVQQVQLLAADSVSLVGSCQDMVIGDRRTIQENSAAIIDRNGFYFMWPNQALSLDKEIEINNQRIKIKGICKASPTFYTFPILYTSYKTMLNILPSNGMNQMSFVLVKKDPSEKKLTDQELANRISKTTKLQALTSKEFGWRSIKYILTRTGIPINFGITVFLGILIGGAITAQTFYIFVIENLKQFGTLKALGVTNKQLFQMVITQATLVGLIGYCIGIGLTQLFFKMNQNNPALEGFYLKPQVIAGSFILILIIVLGSIIVSLRKVFKIDPSIVFRG